MKRQYLGDSKDSFKWDYLYFLVEGFRNVAGALQPLPGGAQPLSAAGGRHRAGSSGFLP